MSAAAESRANRRLIYLIARRLTSLTTLLLALAVLFGAAFLAVHLPQAWPDWNAMMEER